MFISIQNSSGTFAHGYEPMPLRTGYEPVLAARVDDLYAQVAQQPGKVVSVSDTALTVEYKDGSTQTFQLGRRYGTVSSLVLPHQLETRLKAGDAFGEGDLLIFNSRYFVPDALQPNQAAWKMGMLVKTAIMETADTLEDSSVISERVAGKMATEMVKVRDITVNFRESIHRMVRVGDELEADSILCTIEDLSTGENAILDDESLDTLRFIAANTPKSKVRGRVERIEVFYNGDIDDMSESLQELTVISERNRKRLAKELGNRYISGRVDETMRVDGDPLLLDNAVIRIHINETVGVGVGDKFVFGNQLKTIVGRVMAGRNETKSGIPLDAIFGYMSISNRIVASPEIIGTTNTLLKLISKRVAAQYFAA